jgi:hypothetical protein
MRVISSSEVSLTLLSPTDRNECIVEVESSGQLLFVLSDEDRGEFLVEFVRKPASQPFAIPLGDLLKILDEAKNQLRRE